MENIGVMLRSFRKQRGLTQQQVADSLGISVRAYQYYETGDRTPTLGKAFKLGKILDIKLEELSVLNSTSGVIDHARDEDGGEEEAKAQ